MNTGSGPGIVNLVVALGCEARPLLRCFGLKQQKSLAGFRLYGNGRGIRLIVTGAGKLPTTAACGFLAGLQESEQSPRAAWLNVGIAGHGSREPGEGLLIDRIVDQASGKTWYPPLLLDYSGFTSGLITVDAPETDYGQDLAYDMEASSFFATANRFATAELVQVYKIVSDNPNYPVDTVTEQKIGDWVQSRLDAIQHLLAQLQALSGEFNNLYGLPEEFHQLAGRVRLTASQSVQLESCFRRFYALGGSDLTKQLETFSFSTARELLGHIESLNAAL